VALAEELLIRLEAEGVAVRLNLLGSLASSRFVVAAWVLPYVYALRAIATGAQPAVDRIAPGVAAAIQTHKLLEAGDATISQ